MVADSAVAKGEWPIVTMPSVVNCVARGNTLLPESAAPSVRVRLTHTRAQTHGRAHALTLARTHARTHAGTRA